MTDSYIVIGAGAFGSSTALELIKAGHAVTVLERSIDGYHSPDAASNDLNKIIRADYSDEHYRELAKRTISLWRRTPHLSPFYHETGVLLWSGKNPSTSSLHKDYVRDGVSRAVGATLETSTLELARDGEDLPPLAYAISAKEGLLRCFPTALQAKMRHLEERVEAGTVQAYFNPRGGWAEADKATRSVLDEAKRLGAKVYGQSQVVELLYDNDSQPETVNGVRTSSGKKYRTEGNGHVIICSGAWASGLLKDLLTCCSQSSIIPTWSSAQCVVAIQLNEEQRRLHSKAPVVLDFTNGFYCFEPGSDGVMKISIHDKGYQHPTPSKSTTVPISFPSFASGEKGSKTKDDAADFMMSSDAEAHIPANKLAQMLDELSNIYPHLANASVVYTRVCFYSESHNEDWIIDHFPGKQGLILVSGDSGHGFKFLPVMGQLVCARLGLPSVSPLTVYQDKVFSFTHHLNQLETQRSESARHRGQL